MKGKYAARADRRREIEALEERAVSAEQERDRLEADLARLRERSEKRIAGLKAELAALTRERDEVAHPRVTQLEGINNRLRGERNAAIDEARTQVELAAQNGHRMRDALVASCGFSVAEAREFVNAVQEAPDMGRRFVSPGGVHGKDHRTTEAIQRLRGQRGAGSPAQDAAPEAQAVVWSRKDAAREVARLREESAEKHLPAFVYDADGCSLVIGAELPGVLHFYIETAEGVADILVPSSERGALAEVVRQ